MDNQIIIAISGKIGSGKDTIADLIIDAYPMFERKAFATRVKEVVTVLTNTTLEQNSTQEGKSYIPPGFTDSLGRLQQKIGEGMKHIFSEDIWVKCLLEDKTNHHLLITDCRHRVEANYIKKKGGYIIRINGDPANIGKLNHANRDLNHKSEIDLDDYEGFDYVIDNSNISKDELKTIVIDIVKSIISK